jgi:hypothetical protein
MVSTPAETVLLPQPATAPGFFAMNIRQVLALVVLATASAVALALPSVEAVQAEVQRGNYAQAEAMMQEVVAAKPGSARARYVYAEILAHDRRFEQAAAEAARARQLDPAISFTDPARFNAFEQLLARERSASRAGGFSGTPAVASRLAVQPAPASGPPAWVWVFGLAGIAAIVWAIVSRRQRPLMPPAMTGPGPVAGTAPGGYGPGYAPVAPSAGSGLMGVGLAAAGGLAAGMLADRLLHGGQSASLPVSSNAGGLVPGMFDDQQPVDDPAAIDLEQRSIDFGQGGDNWDDGGSAGFDGGVSDSSDGGGW